MTVFGTTPIGDASVVQIKKVGSSFASESIEGIWNWF